MSRVCALEDRWLRLQQVIVERAASAEMQRVPGGRTGLLTHAVKGIGAGENFQVVDAYDVDASLLREMREIEKQAAQEVGQWTEKHEHTGADGSPLAIEPAFEELRKLPADELVRLYREALEALEETGAE
jgi:hypothetical protein